MSATEPGTGADARDSAPQFPVVLRGYDPDLVDSRVAELVGQLTSERRRGDQAERALSQLRRDTKAHRAQPPDGAISVEADVGLVLQQAGVVAAGLLAHAGRRIEATIEAAGAKAADRLKVAAEQASDLEQRARATLAQAETERARIQAAAIQAAEQLRARANREASAVVAKAQEDAELAWLKAAHKRRLLAAEADRLTTLRRATVEQLGRVYAPLGLILVDTRGEPGLENTGQR
jgi:colicin import membrane protein